MKAVIHTKYGSPDILQVADMPKPTPKAKELLIKVYSASINAFDNHKLTADVFMVRMVCGLRKPKRKILGGDVCGIVESIGKQVKQFKAGDIVYGCVADLGINGSFAEYVCGNEKVFAPVPVGLSYAEIASIPMACVTALQGLKLGKIQSGQKVLINGAAGGVGSFAVQLAKFFGAEVTAICSAENAETVRNIGADYVLDYKKDDICEIDKKFDIILDIVAKWKTKVFKRLLTPKGVGIVIGFTSFRHMFKIMFCRRTKQLMVNNKRRSDLLFLNGLIKDKKIKPLIDTVYPLEKAADAFWHFEKEHKKGKIVFLIK
jgi:NADPH:quinone reductase-like Zn-dependent oxidoreductase